jgi:Pyridoxamine 5'-phosphate oxidase
MEPIAEQLELPVGYGRPTKLLKWSDIHQRLVQAEQYWLATTRVDGRPHVVPVDGVWFDDVWYFGGDPESVHQRNLRHNPQVAMHLADTIAAVIVEGVAEWREPSDDEARGIAETTNVKYAAYGYAAKPGDYAGGVWGLRPSVVLAWDRLDVDATRFVFRREV